MTDVTTRGSASATPSTTPTTTSAPAPEPEHARVKHLAGLLVRFLETNEAPDGLFADDVFCDFTLPRWRLQARGVAASVALRRAGHPVRGRVPRSRLDVTGTGFLLEVEEEWQDGQRWYCRELLRCDVRHDRVAQISVYCTGDWDEATVAAHRDAVTLLRP